MVNGRFTYTPSGKKRAPSKEIVLRWIDRAWREIPVDNKIVQVLWHQQCSRWNWRWCGLGRRGRRSRRRRRADRQRVRDGQRRRGRQVAELSRAFKQTVLFRTNKSYKVNDQRCLSFVYSFTDIYLHSHFSLALFIWEIWKSYILLRENTRL